MAYVLDTNVFVDSRVYYPDTFPSFWEAMTVAVNAGTISSVKEVRKELEVYRGPQEHLLLWINDHRHIFTTPSPAEQERIKQITAVPRFESLIDEWNMLKGDPVADPLIIAKAWETGGTVVTAESLGKGKTPKIRIPAVCRHFGVNCMRPEAFMAQMGWRF